MKIDKIREEVKGIFGMSFSQANEMTSIIQENKFQEILELGFANGVSTCYIANALDESEGGHITTIDLDHARNREPNIESLLSRCGLAKYVSVYYEPNSYIWRLMKMLDEDPSPRFDFCYLDGAHNWFIDGFAFFLVDRLLNTGGMIVFDDLDWTYHKSPTMKNKDVVRKMPKDERETPQIRKVYELLVKPHPAYGQFMEKNGWAYARKISPQSNPNNNPVRTEIVYRTRYIGFGSGMLNKANDLISRFYRRYKVLGSDTFIVKERY